jgi:hypothetical protein
MGLGNFVSGLTGGLEAAQQLRTNRQLEKIRDAGIRRIEDEDAQLREDWAYRGFNPEEFSDYAIADPLWERLQKWVQNRRNRKRAAIGDGSLSSSMLDVSPQMEQVVVEEYAVPEFADGGRVDMEKINRQQYINARTQQVKDALSRGATTVRDATLNRNVPADAGRVRRAINSPKVGRGVGALALGSTAMDVARTPTEDYRTRFGMKTDDPSLMGDIGVRALGAASDLGNTLTFGQAERFFRDKQASAPTRALPVSAPSEALPRGPLHRAAVRRQELVTVAAPRAAATSKTALPAPQEQPDLTNVSPEEIPDFRVEDWVQHREQLLRSMMRGKRMPLAEALQAVDMQVMQMQQQGFTNYAQQAVAMLQGGDLKGAAAALRVAYQYLPTGRDARFGIQNGRLYALTIDEVTGKPVGKPTEVQPELIYAITDNMRKEGAWQQYAKDRREFQQKLRAYEEVEKPLAEVQGSTALTNAQANATSARAAMMRAEAGMVGGGEEDGLKPSDFDRAGNYFVEKAEQFAFDQELDPAVAERLAAAMSEAYRRNPTIDPRIIVQRILESARSQ